MTSREKKSLLLARHGPCHVTSCQCLRHFLLVLMTLTCVGLCTEAEHQTTTVTEDSRHHGAWGWFLPWQPYGADTYQRTTCPAPNTEGQANGTYEWSGWSTWSDCSVTCGTGLMYKKRLCLFRDNRTQTSHSADLPLCTGEAIIEDACTKAPCTSEKGDTTNPEADHCSTEPDLDSTNQDGGQAECEDVPEGGTGDGPDGNGPDDHDHAKTKDYPKQSEEPTKGGDDANDQTQGDDHTGPDQECVDRDGDGIPDDQDPDGGRGGGEEGDDMVEEEVVKEESQDQKAEQDGAGGEGDGDDNGQDGEQQNDDNNEGNEKNEENTEQDGEKCKEKENAEENDDDNNDDENDDNKGENDDEADDQDDENDDDNDDDDDDDENGKGKKKKRQQQEEEEEDEEEEDKDEEEEEKKKKKRKKKKKKKKKKKRRRRGEDEEEITGTEDTLNPGVVREASSQLSLPVRSTRIPSTPQTPLTPLTSNSPLTPTTPDSDYDIRSVGNISWTSASSLQSASSYMSSESMMSSSYTDGSVDSSDDSSSDGFDSSSSSGDYDDSSSYEDESDECTSLSSYPASPEVASSEGAASPTGSLLSRSASSSKSSLTEHPLSHQGSQASQSRKGSTGSRSRLGSTGSRSRLGSKGSRRCSGSDKSQISLESEGSPSQLGIDGSQTHKESKGSQSQLKSKSCFGSESSHSVFGPEGNNKQSVHSNSKMKSTESPPFILQMPKTKVQKNLQALALSTKGQSPVSKQEPDDNRLPRAATSCNTELRTEHIKPVVAQSDAQSPLSIGLTQGTSGATYGAVTMSCEQVSDEDVFSKISPSISKKVGIVTEIPTLFKQGEFSKHRSGNLRDSNTADAEVLGSDQFKTNETTDATRVVKGAVADNPVLPIGETVPDRPSEEVVSVYPGKDDLTTSISQQDSR